MTDIDFDELDKAVNSMLAPSGGNQEAGAAADNIAKTDETLPNPVVQAQSEPIAINNPTVPIASRPLMNNPRTGRFMDVVPPNVSSRVNIAPADNVSRQGVTVDPDQSLNNPQSSSVAEPEVAELDPINYSDNKEQAADAQPVDSDSEDDDIDQINNDINKTIASDVGEESIDTPFLAGTKVEKRPLGAFSENNSVQSNTESTVSSDSHGYSDTIAVEGVKSEEVPLIVAGEQEKMIESNTVSEPEAIVSAPVEAEVPVAPAETEVTVETIVTPETTPEIKTEATQPVVATSINQQYQEQPSTGDQTNGAIYDTNSYHKAVLQPVKKKSGWLMVVWILLLLVVGAGSGVAVYYFVLPNLT